MEYLEHQGRHIFRSVLILYQIAHSLPVVTALAERTFSRLNLVKTILRSTMTDERLSPLLLLSLNKDISLDIEKIVTDLPKQTTGAYNFINFSSFCVGNPILYLRLAYNSILNVSFFVSYCILYFLQYIFYARCLY